MILLITLGFILVAPSVFAQTICQETSNGGLTCFGSNGSARVITPMGRNGGVVMDEHGNLDTYSIQRNRRAEEDRRDEERRRELIYGDDRRRDDSRSRSRYDDYGR